MNDKQRELSDELEEYATYMKLDGQTGRAKGYERAAHNIRTASYVPPNPADINGVGDSIRTTIAKWQRSGEIPELEELRDEYPWFEELKDIDHVGPARARALHEQLHVEDVDDLLLVGDDITLIDGVGPKTVEKILDSAKELSE